MCPAIRSDQAEAQRRRTAVKMYRAGTSAPTIADKLHHSRSWVYKWVTYRAQHPWTRFRSRSRASHHHPNQISKVSEKRIIRLRRQLAPRAPRRLRFAPVGARSIQREWRKRYAETSPSLSTIQRVLHRNHLTSHASSKRCYRPHPGAEAPNAVQATDLITRWIEGGEVVQTFNTVDIYSNDASSSSSATKTASDARQHLLKTWANLGVPDLAQFDNESAFCHSSV